MGFISDVEGRREYSTPVHHTRLYNRPRRTFRGISLDWVDSPYRKKRRGKWKRNTDLMFVLHISRSFVRPGTPPELLLWVYGVHRFVFLSSSDHEEDSWDHWTLTDGDPNKIVCSYLEIHQFGVNEIQKLIYVYLNYDNLCVLTNK